MDAMLKVENLEKSYADFPALSGVSFEVAEGEVVGFLGPNGAGKTTAMRIITGYLPPTSGTAYVDGIDVSRDSLAVRRRIGYLPENLPVYPDLRVGEYLDMRAKLKGVARRDRKARIANAVDRCWLKDVERAVIGTLSRGYKQRVGIADALLGDPKLLILDEPTIGLDPNQVRQVRELVKELGEKHTILLSTHILPEVEVTCDRIVIVNKGRIVAQDAVQALSDRYGRESTLRLELKGPFEAIERALKGIDGARVEGTPGNGSHRFRLATDKSTDVREKIFNLMKELGFTILEMARTQMTLEDIFARITLEEETGLPGEDVEAAATAAEGATDA